MHANCWHIEDAAKYPHTDKEKVSLYNESKGEERDDCLIKKGEIILKNHIDALTSLGPWIEHRPAN